MNYNKVILVGNVTQQPEMRSLPSGQPVASFGLATNRFWKDKDGNRQSEVAFHNIVAFAGLANIISQYVNKGSMILIEGRIQYRNWEAQDGTKHYRTEIVADNMQLGPKSSGSSTSSTSNTDKSSSPLDDVPVVNQDEETPKDNKKKTSKKPTKPSADEIDIEEDIPF